MKNLLGLALALALLLGAPAFAQTTSNLSDYAPADEYFGPMQMSILDMRNQLQDMQRLYDIAPSKADVVMDNAAMTEAALRDLESKYPNDPALARYVYQLCLLYQKVDPALARQKSIDAHAWLFSRYGQTSYAKDELKRMMEQGNAQEKTLTQSSVKQ